MDSSTKQSDHAEPEVQQQSALPTPQLQETPPRGPLPLTNTFHRTVVSAADQEVADPIIVRPGAFIDGYAVLDTIANTRMSVVFQARQPETGQLVALKLIRHGAFADQEAIDRFQREIQALGKLQPNKNIVPIYHVGRHGDELYYVMPFLAGGSLAKQLERYKADCRKAVALVEKIARAVHLLHMQEPRILHRDIKPANILLAADDEPLLADFGLIKLLDDEDSLTQTHEHPGTPPYMAPEQTPLMAATVTERTDVWALGVVLYELLTGQRPFASDSDRSKLFHTIVHNDPPRPRSIRPDLDAGLEAVILKCLEKRPADRFASAAELADELGRWLAGEAPRTKPRFRHTRLALVAAAAALFCIGIAVAAPAVWYGRHPDRPLWDAQRRLTAGESVVLIGEKSAPAIAKWLHGKEVQTSVDKDGYFTVHTWEAGLLELMSDIPVDSYRLRGKIRHDVSKQPGGYVGIFVGHRPLAIDGAKAETYHQVTYNDVLSNSLLSKMPRNPAKPLLNAAQFNSVVYTDLEPAATHRGFAVSGVAHFRPVGLTGGQWRDFEINVTPAQLRLRFDGNPEAVISLDNHLAKLRRDVAEWIDEEPQPRANLRAAPVDFEPRGSLGIIVWGGSAAFTDFTLEPLTKGKEVNR